MANTQHAFKIFYALFSTLLFSACSAPVGERITYEKCNNLFVVSDFDQLLVFEQKPNSLDFIQRGELVDFGLRQAFIDCKRNLLTLAYGGRSHDRDAAGIALVDMKTGEREDYPIPEGINYVLTRYKNGFLYYTALIKKEGINPAHGYVAIGEKQIEPDGKTWRTFEEVQYFDLDKRKVVQRYPTRMSFWTSLDGENLYTTIIGSVVKINLERFFVEKLFDTESLDGINDNDYFGVPMGSMRTFNKHHDFYFVSNKISYDHRSNQYSEKLLRYEQNSIYKLEGGKFVKVASQPFDDVIEVVAVGDYLYLFTTGNQFVKFNTVSKQVSTHPMPIQKPSPDYEINSVSQTEDALVFTYVKGYEGTGFVVMTDLDLTKTGKPFAIENLDSVRISTGSHIQPNQTIEAFYKERIKQMAAPDTGKEVTR